VVVNVEAVGEAVHIEMVGEDDVEVGVDIVRSESDKLATTLEHLPKEVVHVEVVREVEEEAYLMVVVAVEVGLDRVHGRQA
jgi:hypothetical protein